MHIHRESYGCELLNGGKYEWSPEESSQNKSHKTKSYVHF